MSRIIKTRQIVNVVERRKDNDKYIIIYDEDHRERAMMKLFTWAIRPELNLDIQDAQTACDLIDNVEYK